MTLQRVDLDRVALLLGGRAEAMETRVEAAERDEARELGERLRIVRRQRGMSLEQVELSLRVALRASQPATIRSIAFTEAFVGHVPVWVERVQGDWPLEPGRHLISARDAHGHQSDAAILVK